MFINDIIVTQEALRNTDQITPMKELVARGDVFSVGKLAEYNPNSIKLIELYELEDGKIYCHNGHHRIFSIFQAGRTFLYKDEFVLSKAKYSWFEECNPWDGWYTPYDLRTQVRLADLRAYKMRAAFALEEMLDPKGIFEWIERRWHEYATDREIEKIWELGSKAAPLRAI